jgi:actin-like ATPase involved in cell morphogenesis
VSGYRLGIDLGTTFTAAAVFRDGQVQIASLGNRAATIPSVLFLKEDGEFLVGDTADRRAVSDPDRVAREFKRRFGDSTPILLGTTPFAAEGLAAKLLRYVIDAVSEVEGGPPDHIGITHPANWGPYKTDLLEQATRMADVSGVTFLTEPEAAAIYYASNERVEVGAKVAVYDLGGGTFDVAVLEKTHRGFKILGAPEGIERLGGIDFDHAVIAHVNRSLDGALDELDPEDDNAVSALGRLRQECVEAKEGLSTDTDVSIPVMLPSLQTQVRLTRAEFEAMIRPTLAETMGALSRALRSASIEPGDIDVVLLVGGSSRIPIVAQLVSAELGRPVAVDAHPKHSIAHGAALAAEGFHREQTGHIPVVPAEPDEVVAPALAEPTMATTAPQAPAPVTEPAPAAVAVASPAEGGTSNGQSQAPAAAAATLEPPLSPPGSTAPGAPPAPPVKPPKQLPVKKYLVPGIAALAAVALVAFGVFALMRPGANETPEPSDEPSTSVVSLPQGTDGAGGGLELPAGFEFFSRINSIGLEGTTYVVDFDVAGFNPQLQGTNKHVHFFFDTVPTSQAGSPGSGPWQLYPKDPGAVGTSPFTLLGVDDVPSGATEMCILVANSDHSVLPDTGNCMKLP